MKRPEDCLDAVASARECTGMLPAIPWDGETGPTRRLLRIHRPRCRVYRWARGSRLP